LVLVASLGGSRGGGGTAVALAVSAGLALAAVAGAGAADGLGGAACVLAGGASDFVSQAATAPQAAPRSSRVSHDFVRFEHAMARDCGRAPPAKQSWGVPPASRALPRAVLLLGLTSLFTDVATEMIFPLLPVFIASLGGGATFLGLIEGLADATSSLLKLASGYFADAPGRKKPLVVFGYGLATFVRPFVALATAPWHVLVVRVADRVGKGVRSSPRDALIAASVPHEQAGRAFGFHNAMDHAGAVIGPVTAALLLKLGLPLRTVFWVAALPGLLALIAVSIVREPKGEAPAEPAPAVAPPPAAGSDGGAPTRARLPRSLKSYCLILALFSLGGSSDAFLLLRARDTGVDIALLPLLWTAFNLTKLLSSYLGGSFSDRAPRVRVIVSGWIIYALTYFAFALASRAWHAWALFLLYGTYYGLTEPAEKALVRDLTTSDVRARAYGLYNFVLGACALPAGLMTGWLWEAWSPFVALTAGASLAAAASVALLLWAKGQQPVVGSA